MEELQPADAIESVTVELEQKALGSPEASEKNRNQPWLQREGASSAEWDMTGECKYCRPQRTSRCSPGQGLETPDL